MCSNHSKDASYIVNIDSLTRLQELSVKEIKRLNEEVKKAESNDAKTVTKYITKYKYIREQAPDTCSTYLAMLKAECDTLSLVKDTLIMALKDVNQTLEESSSIQEQIISSYKSRLDDCYITNKELIIKNDSILRLSKKRSTWSFIKGFFIGASIGISAGIAESK